MSTASDGGQQPWGGQPPPYGQPGATAPVTGSNGIAVGALVTGLLSVPLAIVVLGGLLGVVAVVLGVIGVSRARTMGGTGQGMAITGIVSGALGILVAIVVLALGVSAINFLNSEEGQDVIEDLQSDIQSNLSETASP